MNRDAGMRGRLQRGSNALLPLDGLPRGLERRIRGPVFADHQESDRTHYCWPSLSVLNMKSSLHQVQRGYVTILRSSSAVASLLRLACFALILKRLCFGNPDKYLST